jgi:2-polyprenyl-3-methyl-5-hydroxy-6-metoxy-1,4-benzoquinol methylase
MNVHMNVHMNKKLEEKLNNIVQKNYLEIADHYSETRKKVIWEGLFEIAKGVERGAKVLDVGCGSGKLLQAFSENRINYLGIDPSEALLANAHKQYGDYNFENGNIMNLDSFESDYDYVFCIAVLQHIPGRKNRVRAIENLKSGIKKGGKIIITTWDMYRSRKHKKILCKNCILKFFGLNKMDFGDIVFDWKNSKGEVVSKRYYHAYKMSELRKDCVDAGLLIEKIYKRDNNIYVELKK